jgi:signal peptide peptidase SppA
MTEQTGDRVTWPTLPDRLMEWIPARLRRGAAVVPVVRLSGLIGAVTPLRPGMSLAGVARTLERAFSMKNAKAVALAINSPGGSPVQSRQIYLRIRQLAAEKKLPVLVFVEDVAASGGYMIACAGDEIFCDPSSIMGSIGVVGGAFGFQDLIKKIGVERRLYTAGAHKAMLDPFLPENPDDVARVKALQREIHAIFIALVKQSRGSRLKGADDVLFTGEYWAGETSVSLGLADAIGDLRRRWRGATMTEYAGVAPSTDCCRAFRPNRPAQERPSLTGLPGSQIGDFGSRPGNFSQIRKVHNANLVRHLVPERCGKPNLNNTDAGRRTARIDQSAADLFAGAWCAGRGPLAYRTAPGQQVGSASPGWPKRLSSRPIFRRCGRVPTPAPIARADPRPQGAGLAGLP